MNRIRGVLWKKTWNQNTNKKRWQKAKLPYVILIAATFSLISAQLTAENLPLLRRLGSVMDFVEQNYVDEVTADKLYRGAMKGMLEALGDPYSAYLDEETQRDLGDTTAGRFGGVGLTITKKDDEAVEVASAIDGSPGALAGITTNDKIIMIDGQDTLKMTMTEVLKALRGEAGTKVTVTVARGTANWQVELVRAIIEVPTIKCASLPGGLEYIRVLQFTPETAARLREAVLNVTGDLILDLRDNPGGLISSAVSVASIFLNESSDGSLPLVVETRSRIAYENQTLHATGRPDFEGRLLILINGGTASAAEIVSGCLKDHRRALLVGVQSFGKGSVQQVVPLGQGEEIKLTMARYYTPSGANIDKKGIAPDIEVPTKLSDKEAAIYEEMLKSDDLKSLDDKKLTENQITSTASRLHKKYPLDERLLRRIVRVRANRLMVAQQVVDLDFDVQLLRAMEILRTNDKWQFQTMINIAPTVAEQATKEDML